MEHSQDYSPEPLKGHDAMHRARKRDTHPTHACSEQFLQASGGRIARLEFGWPWNGAFVPFSERALSALGSLPC